MFFLTGLFLRDSCTPTLPEARHKHVSSLSRDPNFAFRMTNFVLSPRPALTSPRDTHHLLPASRRSTIPSIKDRSRERVFPWLLLFCRKTR